MIDGTFNLDTKDDPQLDIRDGLSTGHFRQLAEMIEDYAGIRMPAAKKVMVEGRLRRRMKHLGFANLGAYCEHVLGDGQDREFVHLIDAVTTNKTEFFREPRHFEFLARQGLAALQADTGAGADRPLAAWSAACSTGAEPYTLAIVMKEFARSHPGFTARVLGTDISFDVLAQAHLGIFPEEQIALVSKELRRRYFLRAREPSRHEVRVIPELRRDVAFGRLNLMDQAYRLPHDMDIILCRNILIYFDKPTQARVLAHLSEHLTPEGFLIIGHSEATAGFALPLRQVAPTIFRKL